MMIIMPLIQPRLMMVQVLTHSLTYLLTHLLTHSPNHLLTQYRMVLYVLLWTHLKYSLDVYIVLYYKKWEMTYGVRHPQIKEMNSYYH